MVVVVFLRVKVVVVVVFVLAGVEVGRAEEEEVW